jgi:hypothetical protein
MGKIIWLASYPKSGNTWLRVVLTNYLRDSAEPADINDLERTHIASGRALFDEIMGISAAIINSKLGSGRRVFKCELGKHKVKQMRPGVEGLIAG